MLFDREYVQPMRSTLFLGEHHDSLPAFVHSLHRLTGYVILSSVLSSASLFFELAIGLLLNLCCKLDLASKCCLSEL